MTRVYCRLQKICHHLDGLLTKGEGHRLRWVRYPVWQHTFVSPSAFSRRAVVSYWRKYVHEVLVNRLGGLSLPRKSVVRLTDRPDMTLDVYRGRKTTIQQIQQITDSEICAKLVLLVMGIHESLLTYLLLTKFTTPLLALDFLFKSNLFFSAVCHVIVIPRFVRMYEEIIHEL